MTKLNRVRILDRDGVGLAEISVRPGLATLYVGDSEVRLAPGDLDTLISALKSVCARMREQP